MAGYQIHRYAVKDDDQIFVDPATYTESEQIIANNYINFVRTLPGYTGNVSITFIDNNTKLYSYQCRARDGVEEVTARAFFRTLSQSADAAKTEFLSMLSSKGGGISAEKSHTELLFANGHSTNIDKNI
jgi:hypothetical protein